ncbi:hypothetical protein [Mycolicibacterium sp. GESEQ-9]|uniref:hypothetical protein n=1 Tax=unclassified Mycolicibacterium TaxID=2636767 RepID=UPI001B335D2D|nr:hypothetical protein [Mycolicibacterium sp. GESEQ-9]
MSAPSFTQTYSSKTSSYRSGALYDVLTGACRSTGTKRADWTVLSDSTDPYRLDTWNGCKPGIGHKNGEWIADLIAHAGLTGTIHARGLHYIAVSLPYPRPVAKPGRSSDVTYIEYTNDQKSWEWLQSAISHARWLGYVDFEQIHDARNAPPVIRESVEHDADASIEQDNRWWLPDGTPDIDLPWFGTRQPYQLAIVGEKSSLEPVVMPLADEFDADVFLPNGQLSTTLTYRMARKAYDDDRPLIVFYLSDCDPWGLHMPVAVARKLQALSDSHLPGLEWEVHPVALTPDQVREYDLPHAPLEKGEEKQVRAWEAATGVGQTELDAALVLQPDLLPTLARVKMEPYFDAGLAARNEAIKQEWIDAAHHVYADAPISRERAEALDWLDGVRERLPEIKRTLDETLPDVILPAEPEPDDADAPGARWDAMATDGPFRDVTETLLDYKARYGAIE